MPPEMKDVTSSNIKKIGYDPETRELHLHFTTGNYVFEDVGPHVHAALMAADSKGGHFHKHIRGNFIKRGPETA